MSIQLTVMLNVAPIANPIPSATNDTIRPTTANKPNRKNSAGKPLIQYVSAKKMRLNKICVETHTHIMLIKQKFILFYFILLSNNKQQLIVTNE